MVLLTYLLNTRHRILTATYCPVFASPCIERIRRKEEILHVAHSLPTYRGGRATQIDGDRKLLFFGVLNSLFRNWRLSRRCNPSISCRAAGNGRLPARRPCAAAAAAADASMQSRRALRRRPNCSSSVRPSVCPSVTSRCGRSSLVSLETTSRRRRRTDGRTMTFVLPAMDAVSYPSLRPPRKCPAVNIPARRGGGGVSLLTLLVLALLSFSRLCQGKPMHIQFFSTGLSFSKV